MLKVLGTATLDVGDAEGIQDLRLRVMHAKITNPNMYCLNK